MLPLGLDTAATGLYDSHDKGFLGLDYPSLNPKPSGKTIVVYGGSSSVGAQTIMLATASGAKVIAVASEHNFDFCKSLGASEVSEIATFSLPPLATNLPFRSTAINRPPASMTS